MALLLALADLLTGRRTAQRRPGRAFVLLSAALASVVIFASCELEPGIATPSAPANQGETPGAVGELGTRENPLPIGTVVDVSDGWEIKVVSVLPAATELVLQHNRFNSGPEQGHEFFIARIETRYTGPGSSRFFADFRIKVVGKAGLVYTTFENGCGVIPAGLPDQEAFTGVVITGNVCWEIRSGDRDSLVLFDDPFPAGSKRLFLSLVPADERGGGDTSTDRESTTASPTPEVGEIEPQDGFARALPARVGTALETEANHLGQGFGVRITIEELIRGEEAFRRVRETNRFSDEPQEDHEYAIVRIRVEVLSGPDDQAKMPVRPADFTVISAEGLDYSRPVVSIPTPVLWDDLSSGSHRTGWVVYEVRADDHPLLTYGRDAGGQGGLWWALDGGAP